MPTANFPTRPPAAVVNWFKRKKLKPSFSWVDVWQHEHQTVFTVAKATQLDLLGDIHDAVKTALENGQTLQQFKKQLTPILQKKGWWGRQEVTDPKTGEVIEAQLGSPRRLKIIYDTNLRTARAAGQWDRIQKAKRSHPYLLYTLGPSLEHRPQHAKWNRLLLPVDDLFWDTHYPQNGWGCKCRVRQVSEREYQRLKGTSGTKAPKIKTNEWTNKRTGEIVGVPDGIDPGWAYNPGKDRLTAQLKHFTDKLAGADYEQAKAATQSFVESSAFADWYKKPKGSFPVGVVPKGDRVRIGAKPRTLIMSDETALKQKRVHGELKVSEYRQVQQTIDQGDIIADGKKHLIYVLESAGYVSVVKASRTGNELFLQSFRRLSSNAARRDKEIQRLRDKKKQGGE